MSGGKSKVVSLLNKEFGYKNLVIIGDGSTDAEACPPAVSSIKLMLCVFGIFINPSFLCV